MKALEKIAATREYLDYLERHIKNVEKAWKAVQEKCKDFPIIYDDYKFHSLDQEIKHHDASKLSSEEFTQYREYFHATEGEKECESFFHKMEVDIAFRKAWQHHKDWNPHHWQNWTENNSAQEIHCTHMVIDWLAMSYEFGNSPRAYYEKNKDEIKLPDWAVKYIHEMFDALEK